MNLTTQRELIERISAQLDSGSDVRPVLSNLRPSSVPSSSCVLCLAFVRPSRRPSRCRRPSSVRPSRHPSVVVRPVNVAYHTSDGGYHGAELY